MTSALIKLRNNHRYCLYMTQALTRRQLCTQTRIAGDRNFNQKETTHTHTPVQQIRLFNVEWAEMSVAKCPNVWFLGLDSDAIVL